MTVVDHFLDGFFRPTSVAIVGATDNLFKINYRLLQNLIDMGYKGKIFPVNPSSQEISGIKTYARLKDIGESIDLVVSAVPSGKTLGVVRECVEVGIKRLVIVTGGFSEGGEAGHRLHEEIASLVKDAGIRTLGPNTLSPVNTANKLIISFHHVRAMNPGGRLSLVFQSGFYEPRLNWLFSDLGINKILDTGNKMDINEVDALEYFRIDPDTEVIAMHLESIQGDAREFYKLVRQVSQEKPLIILKSGRTRAGSLAAMSHTGAMARENDKLFEGILRQTAAIRVYNWQEFFDLAKAFSYLDPPKGDGMAVITMSGGEGVMATDACELNALRLSRFSDATYTRLREIFPPWEMPVNPLDGGVCMQFHVTNPFHLLETLRAIPQDDDVGGVVMQMPPKFFSIGRESAVVKTIVEAMTHGIVALKNSGKPFALWRASLDTEQEEWIHQIQAEGVPVFDSAERAIRAFAAMKTRADRRQGLNDIEV